MLSITIKHAALCLVMVHPSLVFDVEDLTHPLLAVSEKPVAATARRLDTLLKSASRKPEMPRSPLLLMLS